jgi:hypothetical protein
MVDDGQFKKTVIKEPDGTPTYQILERVGGG